MKLTTDIKPRKDGTVSATVPATDAVPSGRYVFNPDADGNLTCDVVQESHIGWLLDTGFFFPADEADIDAGLASLPDHDGEGSDDEPGEEPVAVEPLEEQVAVELQKPGKKKSK